MLSGFFPQFNTCLQAQASFGIQIWGCLVINRRILKSAYLYICLQVMAQAEGQQKNLVHSIDSLPTKGPLSCLDQDLLLLKATSAATLSCLGECLNILQSHSQAPPPTQTSQLYSHGAASGESAPGPVSGSPTTFSLSLPSSPPESSSTQQGQLTLTQSCIYLLNSSVGSFRLVKVCLCCFF